MRPVAIDGGEIRVGLEVTYPLAGAPQALERLETNALGASSRPRRLRAATRRSADGSITMRHVVTGLDFFAVPSQDAERSRSFYVDTLGLRPDENARFEAWAGQTCFGIWEPEKMGMEFAPQKNGSPALHVDDVAAARAELESRGVEFFGEILDTGVCHMAFFTDPDGNDLMLHHRYAPQG